MKNLKKFGIVFLALGLFLTGCGGSKDKDTATEGGDKGDLKVLAIVNGTLGDKSFFDSLNEGMKVLKDEHGITTKVVETGFDETKWEPALLDACEGDWDIIIAGTYQMSDYVSKTAQQYPEKKFIVYDTAVDYEGGKNKNVYSIEYKQNEGSFLAGAVAAKASESGKLGFVGGLDIPVINDFLVGFIDGAQYVNKDVKVATAYIGNFNDSGKAKELAFAQVGNGVDVLFPCASIAGTGGLEAAKEKGVVAIGVDSDQSALYKAANDEDMAGLIYTSVLKEVGNSIIRAIELEQEGKLPWGTTEQLGIKEGAIGIAKNDVYKEKVSPEVQELVNELEEKIKSGEIEVKSAFGMTTEEIDSFRNVVKP